MNEIGIRQGRLSLAERAAIQQFPWSSWRDEFARAATCGLAFIEWLFAPDGYDRNPVWTDEGQREIRAAVAATGIPVRCLCADYFIAHPLVRVAEGRLVERIEVLDRLIGLAARAGVRVLVVPMLEAGAIRTSAEMASVRDCLDRPLAAADAHGVALALEADLVASDLVSLVDRRPHPALGICYDTGNAAAKGFDLAADVRRLGPRLSAVHIKDRVRGGASVPLGSGAADFDAFFAACDEVRYAGSFVLETPRGNEPAALARTCLEFLNATRAKAASRLDHSIR
jgi:hexulose-6-phosphate isomerase